MAEQTAIQRWLATLNHLPLFEPIRWPHRELISRVAALMIIALFLVLRIYQFDRFPQTFQATQKFYAAIKTASGEPLYSLSAITVIWGIKLTVWLIESGIFLGYIAAYVSRIRAVAVATGFMQTVFPLIVAGIPILISFFPGNLPRWVPVASQHHLLVYLFVMGLIVVGGLINLVGLLTLRRAFTIMTEARMLITHGIFRFVRHPLYSGHFIMFFGTLILRLHGYTLIMYSLFCVGQVVRAHIEERKLLQAFPDYAAYRESSGMFFPKFSHNQRTAADDE